MSGTLRADPPPCDAPLSAEQIAQAVASTRAGTVADQAEFASIVEQLACTARHYQMLVENMSDVVFRAKLDQTLEWISSTIEELCGYPPAELVGLVASDLILVDELPELAAAAVEVGAGRKADFECRIRTIDGGERWVSATVRPVRGVDDEVIGVVGSLRDIHDGYIARKALAESEEHYRLLAANSSDVVAHSRDGLMLWISPALTPSLGWAPEEWVGRRVDDYVHPEDLATVLTTRVEMASGRRQVLRFRVQAKDGAYRWIEAHVQPFVGADGVVDGVEVSFRTVDSEVEAERELERRATHDQLTGLLSRNEAFNRIAASLGGQRTHGGNECALLFCDLDGFKLVNDHHGHIVGDQVLRGVSRRIQRSVRAADLVARVGGDEILVALDRVHDLAEAVAIAEKVREAVAAALPVADGMIAITMSVGVTLAHPGETVDATINRADQAMYMAKRGGRDRVVAIP